MKLSLLANDVSAYICIRVVYYTTINQTNKQAISIVCSIKIVCKCNWCNDIEFFHFLDLKYLFLVGGFAESPMLQHFVRQEFGDILKVIIPQGVGLSILKGEKINNMKLETLVWEWN